MGLPLWLSDKESTCSAGDWLWSLFWEDPMEKEMTTHSSILAWKIQWTEEPGGLQSTGSPRVWYDWVIKSQLPKYKIQITQNPIPRENHRFVSLGSISLSIPLSPSQWPKFLPLSLISRWGQSSPSLFWVQKFHLFFFFASLPGLQNLRSLTRHQTGAPAVKVPSPNHWTTKEWANIVSFTL